MPSKVGYIQRYLLIIDQVKRNRYISMDKLVDAVRGKIANYVDPDSVGLSKRTIQRDLKEIDDHLNITIKYSKAENGYYIPGNDNAQSDFEMMVEQLNLLGALYMDKNLADFVLREKREPKGLELLPPLIDAIKNSWVTEFYYLKYDNSSSHTRRVEPYALKEFKSRWYLLAMEIDGRPEEHGCIKTWGVDRIRDLVVTRTKFWKKPDYNIEKEFADSFGIYSDRDKEPEEVILSFSPEGGKYNDSFPLHKTQETLIDDEREFRIRFRVKLTYDFIMELLAQSQNMKVIAPEHLKDKLMEIHREAIKMLEAK